MQPCHSCRNSFTRFVRLKGHAQNHILVVYRDSTRVHSNTFKPYFLESRVSAQKVLYLGNRTGDLSQALSQVSSASIYRDLDIRENSNMPGFPTYQQVKLPYVFVCTLDSTRSLHGTCVQPLPNSSNLTEADVCTQLESIAPSSAPPAHVSNSPITILKKKHQKRTLTEHSPHTAMVQPYLLLKLTCHSMPVTHALMLLQMQ